MIVNTDIEKLKYSLHFTESDIEELIYTVLDNSPTDPHYSAVTAKNRIICYIQVMKDLGESLPFHDVKSFFDYCCFTKEEYEAFEKWYESELKIYVGKVYEN